MDMDKATATQLANIEHRTGKSLAALAAIVKASSLSKHGELRDMLKRELGMGHGDANTLVHYVLQSDGASAAASPEAVLDQIYEGPKARLRPIHDKLLQAIEGFGPFEVAPKKGYVSLRGKKQFAMIGPATKSQVEIGLNMKDVAPTARLVAAKPGGMCQYTIRLADPDEVDAELVDWIRKAYDGAR